MKNNFTKIQLLLVVPFILGITIAQPSAEVYWQKTYHVSLADYGESVQQTSDGGYIIAGTTNLVGAGYGDGNILLIKTDINGNELWIKTLGTNDMDLGYSVDQTIDGGYMIVGWTGPTSLHDVYLIKTDSNGNEEWSRKFGGNTSVAGYNAYGHSGHQTEDGGYIAAGYVSYPGGGDFDCYLVKTDSDGDMEWENTFGSTGWRHWERCSSVQQTSDGGYVLSGVDHKEGGGLFLIKTDANGNELWSKTFSNYNWGNSVQQTFDGGYIIAGHTDGGGCLIKTDSDGNEVWSTILGDNLESVQQTLDSGYIATGGKASSVYLTKTDEDGNEQWNKTFGGEAERGDRGNSVKQTTDGGYIIAGTKSLYSGEDDVYLIYYKPETTIAQMEIIGTWRSGIFHWNPATDKWTKMYSGKPSGAITAGDFTGDGKADVASIWSSGLWYQDGDTLIWTQVYHTAPDRIAAGDISGDGVDEIIGCGGAWGNSGIWYRDVANGTWHHPWSGPPAGADMAACHPPNKTPHGPIAAGDVTGDGKADMISCWTSGLWYQDGATLSWTKVWKTAPSKVTCGDVTGDGQAEIIGPWSNGIWYRDIAESKWTKMYSFKPDVGIPVGNMATGDFTGDGKADVASCWKSGLWYQDGDTLGWKKVWKTAPYTVTAGDVTGK